MEGASEKEARVGGWATMHDCHSLPNERTN